MPDEMFERNELMSSAVYFLILLVLRVWGGFDCMIPSLMTVNEVWVIGCAFFVTLAVVLPAEGEIERSFQNSKCGFSEVYP